MPIGTRVRRLLRHAKAEVGVQIFSRRDRFRFRFCVDRVPPRGNFERDVVDGERLLRSVVEGDGHRELLAWRDRGESGSFFGNACIGSLFLGHIGDQGQPQRQIQRSLGLLLLGGDPSQQLYFGGGAEIARFYFCACLLQRRHSLGQRRGCRGSIAAFGRRGRIGNQLGDRLQFRVEARKFRGGIS